MTAHRMVLRPLALGLACFLLCADLIPAAPPAEGEVSALIDPTTAAETLHVAGRQLSVVAARVLPAVVNIESHRESRGNTMTETGSGVIVRIPRSTEVFIVTNRHVIADARPERIDISLHDGRVVHPATVLADEASDLAVLRAGDLKITPAELGDSDNLEIGHFVLAVGSPFGLSESVTLGIISAKGRRALELPGRNVINQDFLQTDAAINPGNSGGPLIDLNGRVIGINTAIASQGGGNEGIGFSIPSELVEFVVSQLVESGRVRRGFLGVVLDTKFDAEAARRYGLERRFGARITKVETASAASRAGLQVDDVILNFNGIDVLDETDLINRVSVTPVNQQVRLVILRGGKRENVLVTLTERAPSTSQLVPVPRLQQPVIPSGFSRRVEPTPLSGLELTTLTPLLAAQAGFSSAQPGLLVRSVGEHSDSQSLQLFDVIEQVGRTPVRSVTELEQAIAALADAPEILLQVRRSQGGKLSRLVVSWKR